MFVFHVGGRKRCVLSSEGLNVNWMSILHAFKMVYLMSLFSDKIINRWKMVLPLRVLLSMFNLNFCSFFYNLVLSLKMWAGGYIGGLDSLSHLEVPWIPLADLGYQWKLAVAYYIFQYPFVKANRACLAFHSLRGKLISWHLLAVQYSISVFYSKAYLPLITLTILCEYIFSISMNCLWKLMWNIYSAKQKQFLCRWWIAR